MAYTAKERKEEAAEVKGYEPPAYPWGLQIRLEDEELSKLGIKDTPESGAEMHLEVVAKVTGTSETQMANGDYDRCVTLQITMMNLQLAESAADEKSERETPAAEQKETSAASRRKTASVLTRY